MHTTFLSLSLTLSLSPSLYLSLSLSISLSLSLLSLSHSLSLFSTLSFSQGLSCTDIGLFELGSVYYKYYLVNLQLPSKEGRYNAKLPRISSVHIVVSKLK
eukprot:sb/3478471/